MTTLEDIGNFLKNSTKEDVMKDGGFVFKYIEEVDSVATDILGDLSKEKVSALGAVFQSFVITYMMDKQKMDLDQLEFFMSDQFSMIVILIFKLSVGVAALEEMR